MFGLDSWIAALGAGHPLILATVVAVLLGLRHATDPDHLSAVTALVAGERDRRVAHAARMGLAWGAGHATSLLLLGLPIVLFAGYLPDAVQSAAEAAVGLMIVVLALRLLVRWHRGAYHLHEHDHDGDAHVHLHGHARSPSHAHHDGRRVRTPLGAYAIGLVHGIGGSAGVGVLLIASIRSTALAIVALSLFALFTAVSMAVCSSGFGLLLESRSARRSFDRVAPALGLASMAFGAWYFAGALSFAPYPF
jgi:high-affinity nickel permease